MSTKKNANRIASVKPLRNMKMSVQYTGGQTVTVDFSELPERYDAFKELPNRDFFKRAQVTDWGHTLEWPNGEGLDADRIMEMALEQQGRTDTLAFRQWQDKHGLSLTDAAKAIGVARRTVSQYRTGARPVPRMALLALKGWEAEHGQHA